MGYLWVIYRLSTKKLPDQDGSSRKENLTVDVLSAVLALEVGDWFSERQDIICFVSGHNAHSTFLQGRRQRQDPEKK
jgi:hypothetical protein